MPTYYVMRHGSNSANQSMCQEMLVHCIIADYKERAYEMLPDAKIECFNNQYLSLWTKSQLRERYGKSTADEMIEMFYQDQVVDEEIVDAHCMLCGVFVDRRPHKDAMNAVCKDHK